MRILLASRSPRRADLLSSAGYTYDVMPGDVNETVHPGENPGNYVARMARAKAAVVAEGYPDRFVLSADTVVVIDGAILGKPLDADHAQVMLEQLSGRIHEVLTGVTVSYGQSVVTQVERTRVRFRKLTPNEIAAYVGSGEFQDKAGGYAIQGLASRFVDHIEGSYSNVVGLPIALVDYLLHKIHNEGASESDAFWF